MSHTWTLRIDRRQADRAAIIADLTSLAQAADVSIYVVPESEFSAAPDGGAFRDFVVAATLKAPHIDPLEYVAEHLLDAHRWNVDFMRTPDDAVVISTMTEADLDDVLALQHVAYSDLVEHPEVMTDKFYHGQTLCQLARMASGQAVGYLLAHAWSTAMMPPPWNAPLPALDAADMLYLHDLALAPEARGHSLGTRMTAACLDAARALGLAHAGLIAVQGAQPFWERQGFLVVEPSQALAQKLATYGEDAVYMTRAL